MTVLFPKLKKNYFIYMLFFLFGFDYLRAYIAFIPIVFVMLLSDYKWENKKVNLDFIFYSTVYFAMLLSLLLFNNHSFNVEGKEKEVILSLMIVFSVGGFILQEKSLDFSLKLIKLFLLGSFFAAMIVIAYSFFLDPVKYGYGLLFNPFINKEVNSPAYSNILSLCFISFFHSLFYSKNRLLIKIILIATLIVSFSSAIFLGGRTFFIIVIVGMLWFVFSSLSIKKAFKISISICILAFFVFFVYHAYPDIIQNLKIVTRFTHSGLESKRFSLYLQAINDIPNYPFGGFSVDQSIDTVKWFHNILFDTARVGGWIPLMLLMILFIYPLKAFLYKYHQVGISFILCLLLLVFLIMQQDVVIEGERKLLSLFLFLALVWMNSSRIVNTKKLGLNSKAKENNNKALIS